MKKSLFTVLVLAFLSINVYAVETEKTEKVCIKDAKGKDVCKIIKKHKKLEGTQVPEKTNKK